MDKSDPSGEDVRGLASALRLLAEAVTPAAACGARDDSGGFVSCLTEAVMGLTTGLCKVADGLDNIAEAIRESRIKE